MQQNRVQLALARRERMRRSRDRAWMFFAAFAAAAVFGWVLIGTTIASETRAEWWAMLIYAAIAILASYFAYRAFGAGMRRTRKLEAAQPLDGPDEREGSVWKEIWGRRS